MFSKKSPPGENMTDQSLLNQNLSGQFDQNNLPSQFQPSQGFPNQFPPSQNLANQFAPSQGLHSQFMPSQNLANQFQFQSSQNLPNEFLAGQSIANLFLSGQTPPILSDQAGGDGGSELEKLRERAARKRKQNKKDSIVYDIVLMKVENNYKL